MSLVDANVVLRYLLDDHDELSAKAAGIIEEQEGWAVPIRPPLTLWYSANPDNLTAFEHHRGQKAFWSLPASAGFGFPCGRNEGRERRAQPETNSLKCRRRPRRAGRG